MHMCITILKFILMNYLTLAYYYGFIMWTITHTCNAILCVIASAWSKITELFILT